MRFIVLLGILTLTLLVTLACEKFSEHEKGFKDISFASPVIPCLLTDNQLNFTVLEQGYNSTEQDHSSIITTVTSEYGSYTYGDTYNLIIEDSDQNMLILYFKEKPLSGMYKINFEYAKGNLDLDQVNIEFTKNSSAGPDEEYEIESWNIEKDTLYVDYSATGDLIINFCGMKLSSGGTYWVPNEYDVSGNIIYTD